jgi:hypothetical protein
MYIYTNKKWTLAECRQCHGDDYSGIQAQHDMPYKLKLKRKVAGCAMGRWHVCKGA